LFPASWWISVGGGRWNQDGGFKAWKKTVEMNRCLTCRQKSGFEVKTYADNYTDYLECIKSTTGFQGTVISLTSGLKIVSEQTVRVVAAELNHRGWRVTYDASQRAFFEAAARSGSSSGNSSSSNGASGGNTGDRSSIDGGGGGGGGLSTGAKAGIAIGVVLAVLALALGVFVVVRRRRRGRQGGDGFGDGGEKISAGYAAAVVQHQVEAGAKAQEREQKTSELHSAPRVEMDGSGWDRPGNNPAAPVRSPVELQG
jgi:hypothetical protein